MTHTVALTDHYSVEWELWQQYEADDQAQRIADLEALALERSAELARMKADRDKARESSRRHMHEASDRYQELRDMRQGMDEICAAAAAAGKPATMPVTDWLRTMSKARERAAERRIG